MDNTEPGRTATPLRGVLLDLDGTILDHDGAVTRALAGWLPELDVASTDQTRRLWFAAQDRHLVAWRRREISFAEQRRRRLRDSLPAVGVPVPADDAALDGVFHGYLRHYERSWQAYDDVPAALAAIAAAGLCTAVLTNGSTRQQHDKLARIGLTGRLGPVYTAEELAVAKPSPDAFLAACRRWGLPPGAVLHVGDDHDLDVRAAREAGLHAVHLDRTGTGPAGEPLRIASLRELPALLAPARWVTPQPTVLPPGADRP